MSRWCAVARHLSCDDWRLMTDDWRLSFVAHPACPERADDLEHPELRYQARDSPSPIRATRPLDLLGSTLKLSKGRGARAEQRDDFEGTETGTGG